MGPDANPNQQKPATPPTGIPSGGGEPEPLQAPRRTVSLPLGRIVITPGAMNAIPEPEVRSALLRHAGGDWGTVDTEDWKENDFSVKEGFRILSAYEAQSGEKFWILTEADRSSTCILLPEEY